MKVKDLIRELKKYNQNMVVVVFANGDWYPPISLQCWSEDDNDVVEIGCGWSPIEEDEE